MGSCFQYRSSKRTRSSTLRTTLFQRIHRSGCALRARSVMLQLHGFSNATKTNAGRSANMIVSDTTKFPGRYARRVAEEFKFNFGKSHTRLYPLETRWLGGTNNHQANLVQQLGSVGFLHLEMNPSFRQQLAATASVREQFFASILAGIGQ